MFSVICDGQSIRTVLSSIFSSSPGGSVAWATEHRRPRLIITDRLRSYAAAKRLVMPGVTSSLRLIAYIGTSDNSDVTTRSSLMKR